MIVKKEVKMSAQRVSNVLCAVFCMVFAMASNGVAAPQSHKARPNKNQDITLNNGLRVLFRHDPEAAVVSGSLYFKNIRALYPFLLEHNKLLAFMFLKENNLLVRMCMMCDEHDQGLDVTSRFSQLAFFCNDFICDDNLGAIASDSVSSFEHDAEKFKKDCREWLIERKKTFFDDEENNSISIMPGLTDALDNNPLLRFTKLYYLYNAFLKIQENFALRSFETNDDFFSLSKCFFNPANMILDISGNFSDHSVYQKYKQKICTYFATWENQKELIDVTTLPVLHHDEYAPVNSDASFVTLKVALSPQDLEEGMTEGEVTIAAFDNAQTIDRSDSMAMLVLAYLINNKLAQCDELQSVPFCEGEFFALTEDQNVLFYDEDDDIELNSFCGSFIHFSLTTDIAGCDETKQYVMDFFKKVTEHCCTQEELDEARCDLQENMIMSPLGEVASCNFPLDYGDKQLQKMKVLTPYDIQHVAQKYLNPAAWQFVVIEHSTP